MVKQLVRKPSTRNASYLEEKVSVLPTEKLASLYDSGLVDEMIKAIEGQKNADYTIHGKTGKYANLSLCEKAQTTGKKQSNQENEDDYYTVEQILKRKKVGKRVLYLVKWEGFSTEEATWEPMSNLQNVKQMVIAFNAKEEQLEILNKL